MEYTKLGNSDLRISRICMGCMGFGEAGNGQHSWTVDEAHSREIIKKGLELGVNFFDTAIAYQSGTSEQYLGRTLRDFAKRDKIIVATKFLPRTPEEVDSGVSLDSNILKKCSIKALKISVWIMWIYISIICGTMQRRSTILWRD